MNFISVETEFSNAIITMAGLLVVSLSSHLLCSVTECASGVQRLGYFATFVASYHTEMQTGLISKLLGSKFYGSITLYIVRWSTGKRPRVANAKLLFQRVPFH